MFKSRHDWVESLCCWFTKVVKLSSQSDNGFNTSKKCVFLRVLVHAHWRSRNTIKQSFLWSCPSVDVMSYKRRRNGQMFTTAEKKEAEREGGSFLCWAVESVHQTGPKGASSSSSSPRCSAGGNEPCGWKHDPAQTLRVGATQRKNVIFSWHYMDCEVF